MPRESKISRYNINVIAEVIHQCTSDISDVRFYERGEKSLCYMISKRLKEKLNNKNRMLYIRLWEKNMHNLQDIVRKMKEGKNNTFSDSKEALPLPTIITRNTRDSPIKLKNDIAISTYSSNNEEEKGIRQSDINNGFIETPKRTGIKKTNIQLFSEHHVIDGNENIDDNDKTDDMDNVFEISDKSNDVSSDESSDKSNEVYDGSDILPPSKSPSIRLKYCIDHDEVQVNTYTLKYEDNSINKENVRAEICKFMLHTLKFPCPLSFFGGIRKNIDSYVTYARCRYKSHHKFFRYALVKLDEGICTFFISGTKCEEIKHEGPTIFCSLRGNARQMVKEQLQHVPPRTLQREIAKRTDPELAQEGHMQDLRLLSTYQKAKSEHNCRNDRVLNSSDLSDLFQQWIEDSRNKDPYIRYVGLPLYAIMYSQEQLDIIDINDRIAHFDATGSVVCKPKDIYCKRIMYYAMIIKKGESIIPITEMISSEHDIPSICILLKRYRQFIEINRRKWPLFKVVVVDWSWALINSLMNEWNRCDIIDYLKRTYLSLDEGMPIDDTLLIVHTCCSHFMKRVSSYVLKKFPECVGIKTFILECIAAMLMSTQLLELDEIFKEFITILLTPSARKVQINIARLNQLQKKLYIINETENFEEENQNFEFETVLINEKNENRIFTASPFFVRYNHKYVKVREEIQIDDNITNEYYSPEIAEYITYRLMPFVPMWTSILLSLVIPDVARLSNAYVESYFNIVKKEVLQGEVNLKISRFINKMKSYNSSLIAEAAIKVPLKSRRKTIKRLYPESPLNPVVQEMWQRRKKRKHSHMEGRQLAYMAKKIESTSYENTPKYNTPICNQETKRRQILMQQSNKSTHSCALNNGLFLDIKYYMQDTDINITIGRYSAIRGTPVISDNEFYLFSDQYKTLKSDQWIDGTIIDCFAVSHINRWKHIVYVPTDHTIFILGDYSDRQPHENWLMYNITEEIRGKMLLPYLYQSHWRLLIVDIDKKTITLMDPYKNGKDNKRAIQLFKKFLKTCPETSLRKLKNIKFKEDKISNNRPFQKREDGNNCGVYVLHYLKCIGECKDFGTSLESTLVRNEIAETLLCTSSNMKETCLFCFNTKQRDLVMCNLCRRWAHPQCIGRADKYKSIQEWADPNVTYTCMLCGQSIRHWMLNKNN